MLLHSPSRPRPRTLALAIIGLVAAALFILGYEIDNYALRMVSKPLPVLCMAFWVARLPRQDRYRRWVFAGLLLGMLGDILLEASAATFLPGLVAFLLGHIAYIVAFQLDSRRPALIAAVGSYAYGVAAFLFLLYRGDLGSMLAPVALYVIVICTMLWRGLARQGVTGIGRFSLIAGIAGAASFVFSDTVLAFGRFGTGVDLGRHTVILTYWLGQLGITLSVLRQRP